MFLTESWDSSITVVGNQAFLLVCSAGILNCSEKAAEAGKENTDRQQAGEIKDNEKTCVSLKKPNQFHAFFSYFSCLSEELLAEKIMPAFEVRKRSWCVCMPVSSVWPEMESQKTKRKHA